MSGSGSIWNSTATAHGGSVPAGSSARATVSPVRSASPGNGTARVSSHRRNASRSAGTPVAHARNAAGSRFARYRDALSNGFCGITPPVR